MIILKSLRLSQFLSHRETTINFSPEDKLLLDGDSGSGKSSIFEAIIWSLYGVGRSGNASLVQRGGKSATVHLELTDGQTVFVITRSISAKGKHTLVATIDGVAHPETRIRELQSWIEKELTGASYLLFVNSIAYLQGGSETFVTQTAARRKDLLLEIVRAGDFEDYYEKTKTALEKVHLEKLEASNKNNEIAAWYVHAQAKVLKKSDFINQLEAAREKIKDNEARLTEITKELATKKQAENIAEVAENSAKEAQKDAREAENAFFEAEEVVKRLGRLAETEITLKKVSEMTAILDDQISAADLGIMEEINKRQVLSEKISQKPAVNDYTSTLTSLDRQAKAIHSREECPAGDACPHQKGKGKLLASITEEVINITLKMTAEKRALKQWQKEYDALPQGHLIGAGEITALRKTKADRQRLNEERSQLEKEIAGIPFLTTIANSKGEKEARMKEKIQICEVATKTAFEAKNSIDAEAIKELEREEKDVRRCIKEGREVEASWVGDIAVIKDIENQMPKAQEELRVLAETVEEKGRQEHKLTLLKDAFGSKGIRSIIVDYLLPSLETKINEILSQMSDFQVHLDTQQEKADGDGNKEGLFITVCNEVGEEMDFNLYSGGEKLRIVVAITEGLASLTKKIGFRMMDEVIHSLPQEATMNFTEVLQKLQGKYPQMLMISHLQEVKDMFERVIYVKKHNGITTITETR